MLVFGKTNKGENFMKKSIKKIMSMFLIATMLISTSLVASASEIPAEKSSATIDAR